MIQHVRLTGFVLFFTLSIAGCQFTNSHYSTAKAIHNNGSRVTVKASKLNLRQCPSHKCRILQVLDHGEALTVLSQKDIWLEVKRQKDGTRGWLSSKYVISREKSSAVQTKRIKTQGSAPSPIKNREQVPQNVAEDSPPKPEISTSAMLEEEITVATEKRKIQNNNQEHIPAAIEDEFLTVENSPTEQIGEKPPHPHHAQTPTTTVQEPQAGLEPEKTFIPLPPVDPTPQQEQPETPQQVEDEFAD